MHGRWPFALLAGLVMVAAGCGAERPSAPRPATGSAAGMPNPEPVPHASTGASAADAAASQKKDAEVRASLVQELQGLDSEILRLAGLYQERQAQQQPIDSQTASMCQWTAKTRSLCPSVFGKADALAAQRSAHAPCGPRAKESSGREVAFGSDEQSCERMDRAVDLVLAATVMHQPTEVPTPQTRKKDSMLRGLSIDQLQVNELRSWRKKMLGRIQELQEMVQMATASVSWSFDRNSNVRRYLRLVNESARATEDDIQQNCLQKKLGSLELFVTGEHLPDSDWDRKAAQVIRKTEGQPQSIDFDMGPGIFLQNADEHRAPLFSAAGYLWSEAFKDRSPLDLTEVRITKKGSGYQSMLNCWSILGWSRWGLGKDCEHQNRETHRYRLDDLEIRVNNQVFFKETGIGFVFEMNKNVWQSGPLSSNPDHQKFLSTVNCQGGS